MADEITRPYIWPLGEGNLVKLNQVAYATRTVEDRYDVKKALGLQDSTWIADRVTGDVELSGLNPSRSVAFLEFNYDYGIEIEILTYLSGPNWHDFDPHPRPSWYSHQGIHVDTMPEDFPFRLVQEMRTTYHTNPYLIEKKRTFHYRIFDTRPVLGVFTKFIKRIEPE